MEGLDSPVEHFRKPGDIGDMGDRDAGFGDYVSRSACRHDLDVPVVQRASEIDDSIFIGNTEQCTHGGVMFSFHSVLADTNVSGIFKETVEQVATQAARRSYHAIVEDRAFRALFQQCPAGSWTSWS